jgi:hypothetical protein
MNSIAFALSLIASLVSTPAAPKRDAGIIALDRIGTVAPARPVQFKHQHQAKAPSLRYVVVARNGNKVTRTLAGDKSGQTVTYTEQ